MLRTSFLVGCEGNRGAAATGVEGTDFSIVEAQDGANITDAVEQTVNLDSFWRDTKAGLGRRLAEADRKAKDKASRAISSVFAAPPPPDKGPNVATLAANMKSTSMLKAKVQAAKQRQRRRSKFVILPRHHMKVWWDLFVGVFIIYSVVIIPWRIAYEQDSQGSALIFDTLVDCIFGVDMILCFVTAFYEEDKLVVARDRIALSYLQSWFVPDFLATVPFDRIVPTLLGVSGGGNVRSLKMIKVLRLFRLLKFMRILRLGRKLANIDFRQYVNPAIIRLVQLLGKILFASHLISCMWFLVDECSPDGADNEWEDCGGEFLYSKYLASFYWTIATLMSVGYGEISADTDAERLYALVTEVIGATAFGFIIAMVTVIVETMNPQATAKAAKMDEIREYMRERRLTSGLQRRIRKHFNYYYGRMSVFKEVPLLRDLPHALRVKLAYDTHKDIIKSLRFLDNLDVLVIAEVIYRLKPMHLDHQQFLGKTGDTLEECYFVLRGKVEALMRENGQNVLVAMHSDGSDFELSSLVHCRSMQFYYRATVSSELMWLNSNDVLHIMADYQTAEHCIITRVSRQEELLDECLAGPQRVINDMVTKERILVDWELTGGVNLEEVLDSRERASTSGETKLSRTLKIRKRDKSLSTNDESREGGHSSDADNNSKSGDFRDRPQKSSSSSAHSSLWSRGWWRALRARLFPWKHTRIFIAPAGGAGSNEEPRSPGARYTVASPKGVMDRLVALSPRRHFLRGKAYSTGKSDNNMSKKGGADKSTTLVEAMETADDVLRRFIVLPTMQSKIYWDVLIGACIISTVIIIPFRIGFDYPARGSWLVMDWVIDVCFFVDIALTFRTAYLNDSNLYVTVPRMIAKNYIAGWFALDFMSTFPLDRIMELAAPGGSGVLRSLKLVRVLRLMRLLRIMRLFKLANENQMTEELLEFNAAVFRGLKLLLTLAFLGHLFGCFWSMVSVETMGAGDDTYLDTWWGALNITESEIQKRYIASTYWAFTTMTTVGYGDIQPQRDPERLYATVIMVIGATVFGYIVGSVSSLASNSNGSQALETEKLLAVTNYLEEKKVQIKLRQAVKKHVEYFMSRRSAFDEEKILSLMPPYLRLEATLQGYRDVIGKIELFKKQDDNLIAYVVRMMVPYFCIAGNFIYSPEEGSDGIFHLVSGIAEAVKPVGGVANEYTVVQVIEQGRFFGHGVFINHGTTGTGVRAFSDCGMLVLHETGIMNMVDVQPELALKLRTALKLAIFDQDADLAEARDVLSLKNKSGSGLLGAVVGLGTSDSKVRPSHLD